MGWILIAHWAIYVKNEDLTLCFFSASSGDLQSVDGIGKNIAERIKWAVSEQTQPYEVNDHPQSGWL